MILLMSGSDGIKIYRVQSGMETGRFNMALDEALLDWVRLQECFPILIVRTYQWRVPTLSGGVHQSEPELLTLLKRYSRGQNQALDVVRRPTGGRAILHGDDISFSFITNAADVLKLSLMDSYFFFTALLKVALTACGVEVMDSEEMRRRAYTLSPVCFETKTPSDVVDMTGRKIAGCAQLRRSGGMLQHGAAFLKPFGVSEQNFSRALFQVVAENYGRATVPDFPAEASPGFAGIFSRRLEVYTKESAGMLDKALTTAGSHLTPASC